MSAGLVNKGRNAVPETRKTAVDAGQLLNSGFLLCIGEIRGNLELFRACQIDDSQLNKMSNTEE